MDTVFQTVLEMSLSGAVLVAAVVIARALLKKAPKWIICLLWALVAVRLLCPVSFESQLSMMPDIKPVTQQIIAAQPSAPTGTVTTSSGYTIQISPDIPEPEFLFRFWMVWAAGLAGMLIYMLCSFLAVRRRVAASLDIGEGVRQCDHIDTPFILGLLRPRIYLPSSLPPESTAHVLAHERAHLARKDHWWKPLGFLLLSIHWFNPFIWLGYILLCRDIELACDEKVIRGMDAGDKKAYSKALLGSSVRQRFITACPLAFGELGVKARVKSILNYKKPAFWIVLTAIVLSIGVAVCFLTVQPEQDPSAPVTEPAAPDKGSSFIPVGTTAPTGIVELTNHFEGKFISREGPYIKVRVESANSVQMLYINISSFPDLPELKAGDIVLVHCNPPEDSTFVDDVTEVRRIQLADWGVAMRVSDVSATGLDLWIGASSGFPRTLTTTAAYYLEQKMGNDWLSIPCDLISVFSAQTITVTGGNTTTLNWANIYGTLEPGQYRLCKTVSFEGEDRVFSVEFTVPQPLATSLDEAVTQTVRYLLSKQLVNPSLFMDKTLEHIPQDEDTGFLDEPSVSEPVGATFQQIAESHLILDHQQNGKVHTLSIIGLCRGYNNRQLADEFFSPMLMVIEESADGTFTATSCKMPTQMYWQADIELLFPADIAVRILDDWMSRDTLEKACDEQVTGGAIQLQGFGITFAEDSTEGKLILQAIENGKKLKNVYQDGVVSTIFIGDKVYYYYSNAGIIQNVTDNDYTQLTEEGRGTLKTILGLER